MYSNFTERAKKVINIAEEEANKMGHNYVGTEHLILAILKEGNGIGNVILKELKTDINYEKASKYLGSLLGDIRDIRNV